MHKDLRDQFACKLTMMDKSLWGYCMVVIKDSILD